MTSNVTIDRSPLSPQLQARLAEREQAVLGQPPRIAPLDRLEAAEAAHESTARLRKAARSDGPPLPLDKIPEIVFTMLRFPDLWESLSQMSVHLLGPNSVLPKRDRELAIIRTAWLCLAPFEWGEHVGLAKQFGASAEEIEQVIVGSSDPRWNDHDRALMRAAEELREQALMSEETWGQLARRFDDHQMVELLILIGHFASVAAFQNTLRLRLESYNPGFAAR